jgi:hypothetical protein
VRWLTPAILATRDVEMGGWLFEASLGKKKKKSLQNPISTSKLDVVEHVCHASYAGRMNRGIQYRLV